MKKLIEAFGWYGAGAILLAYALVSFSVLLPTGLWYQVLNISGALGIIIVSLSKKAWQPAALNFAWIVIALFAVARLLL